MFPDLFAFTIPIVWILGNVVVGQIPLANLPHPHGVYAGDPVTASILLFADTLYTLSHSAIVFFSIIITARLVTKKIPWVLMGWGLHILMDIPTHAKAFYPTPVFWPLSNWTFDGIPWATPWFILLNYSLLLVMYCFIKRRKSK